MVLTVFSQDRNMLLFKEMKEYQKSRNMQVQNPKRSVLKQNQ